ncbi:type 4a pilus biogenesis protein PilO [Candidatus Gottesmanbacteria bacterium]|nr:type 4a pilus biogenesis protein PilO [Candidatus Gottesmanbacteria bacterium]
MAAITSHRYSRYYTALRPFLARPEARAYTMFILSLFAISFFGYFAIRPTLTTITNLRRQITDARFVDQKLQEKINALSKAQIEYEMVKPDLEVIFTALPQESKFPPFVKSLEKIASESGTSLVSLSFQTINLSSLEATGAAKETPIGFSLTVSGDYANLANFVRRLTDYERLVIIEKMDFSTKKEKKELYLTLTGQTFYVQ